MFIRIHFFYNPCVGERTVEKSDLVPAILKFSEMIILGIRVVQEEVWGSTGSAKKGRQPRLGFLDYLGIKAKEMSGRQGKGLR